MINSSIRSKYNIFRCWDNRNLVTGFFTWSQH